MIKIKTVTKKIKIAVKNVDKKLSNPYRWNLDNTASQEEQGYVDFHAALEKSIGEQLNKSFDYSSFDEIANNVKNLKIVLFCSSSLFATSLVFGLMTAPVLEFSESSKHASALLLSLSLVIFMFRYKLRRHPEHASKEELLKQANSPETAKIALSIIERIIAHKTHFFVREQEGKILKLPNSFLKAHNRLLFLLGNPEHKGAIFMTGALPRQQLLIRKQDAQSLFPVFKKATSKNTSNKPNNRQNDYLYTVLNNKSALKAFLETLDTPDFFETLKAHPVRSKWKKALEYIYEHWDSWEEYRDKKHSIPHRTKFSHKLAECLGTTIHTQSYKNFRRSRNRDLNKWIKSSSAISDEVLLPYESIPQ